MILSNLLLKSKTPYLILFGSLIHGGGTIKRKMILSVLLLFSLALVFNVNFSSAAAVNQTNMNISANSVENTGVNVSAPNYTIGNTNSNSDTNLAANSKNNTKINNTMAAGEPVLVNNLTLTQLKDGVSRVQTFYDTYGRLPNYVTYGTRQITMSTFLKNIATQGLKIYTTKINGLTYTQLKDGLSRAQTFYNNNGRLPSYVTYGTRTISITTFQQNLATVGLKISTPVITSSISALANSLTFKETSTYDKAVKIFNWVRDNINYSFYYNTQYGAARTLALRTGNCCDTSNLLVALAREIGITARYVHGTCQFTSGTWYGHVWAQLYIGGKWYNADAISYSNSLGIINNWNTSTYKLNGIYTTLPF